MQFIVYSNLSNTIDNVYPIASFDEFDRAYKYAQSEYASSDTSGSIVEIFNVSERDVTVTFKRN